MRISALTMKVTLYMVLLLIPVTILFQKRRTDTGDFDIIFQQNLDHTPVGIYGRKQWSKDWGNPEWANGIYTGDRTIIEESDLGGRFSPVMKWSFPKATFSANSSHGYQWRTALGGDYEEVYLSYSIMFKPGFKPGLGGKLPGMQGSPIDGPPEWGDGFGGSLMFKPGPKPMFYIYHHDMQGEYGEPKEWNYIFDVSSEIWYDITYRIVMNTATATGIGGPDGANDGILEGYVNGVLVGQWTGLKLRNLSNLGIDMLRMQAFFGGNSSDWKTARDEWILIDNVYVWTYNKRYLTDHPEVKRGRQANDRNAKIYTPIDAFLSEESK